MTPQDTFLKKAFDAANAANHIFPEYAACEVALESGWGQSKLAIEGNNLFGEKQTHPRIFETLILPTREFIHGAWIVVQANWIKFPTWSDSFNARMQILQRLRQRFRHYDAALKAADGEQFILEVSQTWSTDPHRAGKVLSIHDLHKQVFAPEAAVVAIAPKKTLRRAARAGQASSA